ncbi:MAG: hypothetical protein AB1578_20080 [Thermodesulfobacteriota bacterium]
MLDEAVGLIDPVAARGLLQRAWCPEGPRCPGCGARFEGRQAATWEKGGRVHCNGCGQWVTYRTGTPLHGSVADERQVVLVGLLTAAGAAVPVIAQACRLSPDTVRAWQRRLAGSP